MLASRGSKSNREGRYKNRKCKTMRKESKQKYVQFMIKYFCNHNKGNVVDVRKDIMKVLPVLHQRMYMVQTGEVCREGVGSTEQARKGKQEMQWMQRQGKHRVCEIIKSASGIMTKYEAESGSAQCLQGNYRNP